MDASSTPPAPPERQSKLLPLAEAITRFVPPTVQSLVVGGMHLHNMPMALVRELVRQRAGRQIDLLLAGPAQGLAADLLIGAGLVREALVSYIGFEHLGLAPAFRRAAEAGTLAVRDVEAFGLMEAVRAGAGGLPFATLPGALGRTDVPAGNPDLYRPITDPFSGGPAYAIPAIRPQVALLHCQEADVYGNGVFKGTAFADRLFALAADTVILQVERIVEPTQILRAPQTVGIPGFRVAAVVQVNFGAHPTSSHRYYNYDEIHLKHYLKQAATAAGFDAYVAQYIDAPGGVPDKYMDAVHDQEWEQ
jgi:glutaconate CoA-transferase subunit A